MQGCWSLPRMSTVSCTSVTSSGLTACSAPTSPLPWAAPHPPRVKCPPTSAGTPQIGRRWLHSLLAPAGMLCYAMPSAALCIGVYLCDMYVPVQSVCASVHQWVSAHQYVSVHLCICASVCTCEFSHSMNFAFMHHSESVQLCASVHQCAPVLSA